MTHDYEMMTNHNGMSMSNQEPEESEKTVDNVSYLIEWG
jgi:hypothetical protein